MITQLESLLNSHFPKISPLTFLISHCSTDFNSYGPVTMATTTAHRINGRLSAPKVPGLGVEPLLEVLGNPVLEVK